MNDVRPGWRDARESRRSKNPRASRTDDESSIRAVPITRAPPAVEPDAGWASRFAVQADVRQAAIRIRAGRTKPPAERTHGETIAKRAEFGTRIWHANLAHAEKMKRWADRPLVAQTHVGRQTWYDWLSADAEFKTLGADAREEVANAYVRTNRVSTVMGVVRIARSCWRAVALTDAARTSFAA